MIDDPNSLAAQAEKIAAQLKQQIKRLTSDHRLATRVFFGADGQLSEAATEWLDRLGTRCFADEPTYDPDPRAHAFNDGRRAVFLEILHGLKLDTKRMAALSRQLKEEGNGYE